MAKERRETETVDWHAQARMSPVIDWMLKHGVDLTRENYLDLVHDKMPEPWGAEEEDSVPGPFQMVDEDEQGPAGGHR